MSIRVMTTVWDKSTRTGTALLAMLALADRANDDGYCYPGIASIAAKTRIKERQCINVVQTLEASGELFVDRGVGRHGTSKYLILIGLTEAEIMGRLIHYFDCPKKDAPAIAQRLFKKVQSSAPLSTQPKKVQFLTKKMQTLTQKGAIQRRKGAIAIAPDPSVSINDPSMDTSFPANAGTGPDLAQIEIETEGDIQTGNLSPLGQSPPDDDVPPAPPIGKPVPAPRARNVMMDRITTLTHTTPAMAASQIAGLIKKLKADGFNETHIDQFEMWWCQDWRSKDKQGNRGIVPTVGQIGQLFGVAMAWADKHASKPAPLIEQLSPEDAAALEARLTAEYEAHEAEMNRRRIEAGYIKA